MGQSAGRRSVLVFAVVALVAQAGCSSGGGDTLPRPTTPDVSSDTSGAGGSVPVEVLSLPAPPAPSGTAVSLDDLAVALRSDSVDDRAAAAVTLYDQLDIDVIAGDEDPTGAAFVPWRELWVSVAAPQPGVRFPLGLVTQPWATLTGEAPEVMAGMLLDDLRADRSATMSRVVAADLAASGESLDDATPAADVLLSPPIVLAIVMTFVAELSRSVAAATGQTLSLPTTDGAQGFAAPRPRGFTEWADGSACGTKDAWGWMQYGVSKMMGGLPTEKFPGLIGYITKGIDATSKIVDKIGFGLGVTSALINVLSLLAQKSALTAEVQADELQRTTTTTDGGETVVSVRVKYDYGSDKQKDRVMAINCVQLGLSLLGSNSSLPPPGPASESSVKLDLDKGYDEWVKWSGSDSDVVKVTTDGDGRTTATVKGKRQRYTLPTWAPGYSRPYELDVQLRLDEIGASSGAKASLDAAICVAAVTAAVGTGGIATANAATSCLDIVIDLAKMAYWSAGVFPLPALDHYAAYRPVQGDPISTFADSLICDVSVPFTASLVSSVDAQMVQDWTFSVYPGATGTMAGKAHFPGGLTGTWSGSPVHVTQLQGGLVGGQVRISADSAQTLTADVAGAIPLGSALTKGFGPVLQGVDDSDC